MKSTFGAVAGFQPVKDTPDEPANGAEYPGSDLGRALGEVARVIKGDVGVAVLTVDQGDWDMHTDIGTVEWGLLVQNAGDLARSLAAFLTDLGPWADRVTVVTISEFGRRVQENASGGTDHGYGNVMFLAGAGRQGRHVLRHVARPLQHPRRRPARDHGLPQRAVGDRRQPLRRQPRRRLPRLRPQSRRSDARRLRLVRAGMTAGQR